MYDIVILGGGASGLMCASSLDKSLKVAVVDKNEKVAKKLKISGGGKCNITNKFVDISNFDGDFEFVENVLAMFGRDEMLGFLSANGITPTLRKNRYYFCKTSSDEIIDVLKKLSKNAKFYLNKEILSVVKDGDIFNIKLNGMVLKAKKVVVATGGKSFKTLGATDVGLNIAKSFGIEVKEFEPALVGLTLQKEQFFMKELSGLSCYVHIKVGSKIIKEEMLFAHKGISGPAVLSASLFWKKGEISIDFLPNDDIFELVKDSKKLLSSVIPLPKRLSKALVEAVGLRDKECKKLSKQDMEKLKKLHHYSFAPAGNFGFTKAEVSRGGVLTSELNNYTFESYKVKNLHFIGEVVDVTGELGGYNFQWAFGSGYVCANGLA